MALINKIRQRSGWAIGFVAIGLGFFVVGGDILGPNSTILGKNKTDVGEIAGETIELVRYQDEIDQIKYNYTINYGRNPSENEMFSIRQQAWDFLFVKIAFQEQYDKLGLVVTDDEKWDLVQGNNVSFEIRQAFSDPYTGEFQRDQVINYLKQVSMMPPQQQAAWYLFEQNLKPSRHRLKYDNLLVKTIFASDVEAKRKYQEDNAVAEIRYLYIPYYSVSDTLVKVTDTDLREFLRIHQQEYKVDESVNFSYVSVPIVPSGEDTVYFQNEMSRLKEEFRSTPEDSIFARNNSDAMVYFQRQTVDQLPRMLQVNYSNLSDNDVRGPYYQDGRYVLYKISEIDQDTSGAVKASHILIKWTDESDASKATARTKAQRILDQLKRGADFEQLARENSEDGSAQSGGDLGWFARGQMVKPFEDAAFGTRRAGLIGNLVETQFGFHIIKVTEPLNTNLYHIASIEREIIPGERTRNRAFRKADAFAAACGNYNEFIKTAERDSLIVYTAENIGKNDRRFNNVDNARSVVQWAYNNTSIGEVSKVMELDDQYIIAVLTKYTEEGPAALNDVRDQIEPRVKNEKKAQVIISKLGSIDGTLEELREKYGTDAQIYTSSDLKFSTNSLPVVGFAPVAIGTAFSLESGQKSKPAIEENGVLVIEMLNLTEAPAIADHSTYKNQLEQRNSGRASYDASEAIRKNANIKDLRFRFF